VKATLLLVFGLTCALASLARGQSAADSAGIRATALDYIDGWYSADAPRMERALHPHLAKRLVYSDSAGRSHLIDMTALELVQGTGRHPAVPAAERREDVKIDATGWVDYLQEIKWNGHWVIINVVWENRPGSR